LELCAGRVKRCSSVSARNYQGYVRQASCHPGLRRISPFGSFVQPGINPRQVWRCASSKRSDVCSEFAARAASRTVRLGSPRPSIFALRATLPHNVSIRLASARPTLIPAPCLLAGLFEAMV
jgi:hypothetical protein